MLDANLATPLPPSTPAPLLDLSLDIILEKWLACHKYTRNSAMYRGRNVSLPALDENKHIKKNAQL